MVPPVSWAERSESVVAGSALSTQLKEDHGGGRVDSDHLKVTTSISQDTGSDLESVAKERPDRLPSTSEND